MSVRECPRPLEILAVKKLLDHQAPLAVSHEHDVPVDVFHVAELGCEQIRAAAQRRDLLPWVPADPACGVLEILEVEDRRELRVGRVGLGALDEVPEVLPASGIAAESVHEDHDGPTPTCAHGRGIPDFARTPRAGSGRWIHQLRLVENTLAMRATHSEAM